MSTAPRPMNYRHAYHAGNFADVFKHTALVALLETFKSKPTPFCYLDTHAGRGSYDLGGEEALKTGEAADGIQRLLGATNLPASVRRYVELVRSLNEQDDPNTLSRYPGSPLLADLMLRENDRAILCELQADEAHALRTLFRHRHTFHVHQRDGYEALRGLLPPMEKRGLVLIDPPFEAQEGEFRHIETALEHALTRWPTGRYAAWYPIKLRHHITPFHRWLKRHASGKALVAEFLLHPDNSGLRLNGCGLAIINPPWQFELTLEEILDALCEHLAQGHACKKRIDVLSG